MSGIPVLIHLDPPTFRALEKLAEKRSVKMTRLIEAHLDRSLQKPPAPVRAKAETPAAPEPEATTPPRSRRTYVVLNDEQQAELIELTRLGWSIGECATRYGCSYATIKNWRKRLDVRGPRKDEL